MTLTRLVFTSTLAAHFFIQKFVLAIEMRTQLRISNSQNNFWMKKCASRDDVNTRPELYETLKTKAGKKKRGGAEGGGECGRAGRNKAEKKKTKSLIKILTRSLDTHLFILHIHNIARLLGAEQQNMSRFTFVLVATLLAFAVSEVHRCRRKIDTKLADAPLSRD